MFDMDIAGMDATETLASVALMHDTRTHADLQILRLAQHWADLHPDPTTLPGHEAVPGGERGHVYGGPGCPAVAEFAAAEFGAVIGRSAGSAANLIGQSLALRHRLTHIWAQVESGHAEPWKACTVATACLTLSVEAAAIVDRRVAPIINSVTPPQLENIVKAAALQADPEAARAEADRKAKERGVWPGHTDEHGTTSLHIRAATGAVFRLKTTLHRIADALTELGDTGTLQERMARAVDIISDPALAHKLLSIAHHLAKATPTSSAANTNTTTSDTDSAPTTPAADAHSAPTPSAATADPARTNHDRATDTTPSTSDRRAESASSATTATAPTGDPQGWFAGDEPGIEDEADRDPPHPSDPIYDTPPTAPPPTASPPHDPSGGAPDTALEPTEPAETTGPVMDDAALRELNRKLASIRDDAYTTGLGATGHRPAPTTLYLHITDQTLLAGEGAGVARVERFGPVYTARLQELLGHSHITLKPVIDLDDKLNVNAYEIPRRIREHVKLTHPVEQFPYGGAETTNSTDLDHIQPYNFSDTGPPAQTSTTNLAPLGRYSHRVKTHGHWTVKRLNNGTLEWTTKHGYKFHVNHTGTHPIHPEPAP